MTYDYRLRQVAFVSSDLARITAELEAVFGLRPAFHDPQVGDYGLINGVFPVGGDFIEVVQPIAPDASAGRYLKRRGGDCGYMIILQAEDARQHRTRLATQGVREIEVLDFPIHFCTHFHPGDFAGVLASIDTASGVANWREEDSAWHPAGLDWNGFRTPNSFALRAVTVQHREPETAARIWSERLALPFAQTGGAFEIALWRGRIRFEAPRDADGTGIVALDIAVRSPQETLGRAQTHGLPVRDGAVMICGAALRPVA
ncbi:MAG: VOC family protein [Hyphomonadaceae bacterium]